MTKTSDQLRAEILTAMDAAIGAINAALLVAKDDEVIYCWLNSGLGVQLDGAGNYRVVGVAHATVVDRNDNRRFFNGANFEAFKTVRKAALRKALESAQASRANLATMPLEV